jgi:hypothetical protein
MSTAAMDFRPSIAVLSEAVAIAGVVFDRRARTYMH